MKNNPARRASLGWAGVVLVGLAGAFAPAIFNIDGFDGGFAMNVLGGLVTITGIIGFVIYHKLARVIDGMLKGENLLVHWTYSADEWRRYTETEHIEDWAARKGLFIMVAVISLVIGIGWWVAVRGEVLLILATIGGIIAMTGFTAYVTTVANYRRNRKFPGEVYVTRDGVYLNRQIHIWKGIGTQLKEIVYEDFARSQSIIRIVYSAPARHGQDYFTARIPVPAGKEAEARQVVADILSAHP